MTGEIPSTARYAGGQACPDCERVVSLGARYCQWCGAALETTADESGLPAMLSLSIGYDPADTSPAEIREYIQESFHHVDYVTMQRGETDAE